jgi:4-amino-4-deoxy-L-arabinose transferase-like glycosyltransferase
MVWVRPRMLVRTSVAVFVLVAALLVAVYGNALVFTNDEGIFLEGAQRVAEGQRPYADFFSHLSPGSFWLQALAFRLFGVSMRSGRLPVILDFAAQCALLFWLTARLGSRRAAWAALALFLVFQASTPGLLTSQHRWDSGAFGTLSLALCLAGKERGSRTWLLLGGMAIGLATLSTPSVGLVAAVTAAWLVISPDRRLTLPPYLAGGALVAAAATAWLIYTATLGPLLGQMRWLLGHYSGVNVMPYGSIIGGYAALFEGASGLDAAVRLGLVLSIALPALLPVLAVAAWGVRLVQGRVADTGPILYLVACTVAFAAATFPRSDVMHLAFAAVPACALAAIWASRFMTARAGAMLVACLTVFASLFAWRAAADLAARRPVDSPVGVLRVRPEDEANLRRLLAAVRPGDGLYVHPYLPLFYFLTQARNPTRFSFLGPGMMTAAEESVAIEELSLKPPRWVLFLPVAREDFLRVFPSAGKLDHRFERIEQWIRRNYRPLPEPLALSGYSLWDRTAGSEDRLLDRPR